LDYDHENTLEEPAKGMCSDQVADMAKQTLKTVKEILEKAEDTTQRALERAAPKLQKSVDASMEAPAKGFTVTMKSIEEATMADQVKLLRAYRRFLAGQADFVEAKIKVLEGKGQHSKQAS